MPCNYNNYPPNWKSEIRPRILERDGNKCKICKVPNGEFICRGEVQGVEVWQDDDGIFYDLANGERLGATYWGDVSVGEAKLIKVVLTISHLDHDTSNNDDDNLAALCQLHHNRLDVDFRKSNRKKTLNIKKRQLDLL